MKKGNNLLTFCVSFFIGITMFYSCTSSQKEQNKNQKDFHMSDIPIQRQIYDIQLGEKYSYDSLIMVLQKNMEGLTSEKNYNSNGPKLYVSKDNNYYVYSVNSPNYLRGYLFGNLYWNHFCCLSTLNGVIISIGFSSEGTEIPVYEALYKKTKSILTDKYGKPNFVDKNNENYCFWYYDNTQIDLQCNYSGNSCCVDIYYTDDSIMNEVINQQKLQGFNEL